MCAIAGMLRGKQADAFPAPEKILSTMQRRGPDSEGIFVSEEENPLITLYHARLAVIDPENGRQPMLFPTSGNRYTYRRRAKHAMQSFTTANCTIPLN